MSMEDTSQMLLTRADLHGRRGEYGDLPSPVYSTAARFSGSSPARASALGHSPTCTSL
jgi:hypothetical protein